MLDLIYSYYLEHDKRKRNHYDDDTVRALKEKDHENHQNKIIRKK